MRIDLLQIKNFKGFAERELAFHPNFNLLIGENGAGKTSLLEALAVALGGWLPRAKRALDHRLLRTEDARIAPVSINGRVTFEAQLPVRIVAEGVVMGQPVRWSPRRASQGAKTPGGADHRKLTALSEQTFQQVRDGSPVTLPLLSYYGVCRLCTEPKDLGGFAVREQTQLSRLWGYQNSVTPKCNPRDLIRWLARQAWIAFQEGVPETTAGAAVKGALLQCLDDAQTLAFNAEREELQVTFKEAEPRPFRSLSDGQQSMLAMVGDIALKALTLNPHLGERALIETPGVVLIDELDMHLHPRWQRRIVSDLRRTFPALQFFATTHSPQIIGEVRPEESILLGGDLLGGDRPPQTFGMDSNWILSHVMGAEARDAQVNQKLRSIYDLVEKQSYAEARSVIARLREELHGTSAELERAETLLERIEILE